ncbi:MAG TPA: G1 family glutamic endopeptidase, partial [Actinomycetota bacterium]|nr:G1 family glutamic endopeptidase [Actinomycetota bacterium]
LQITSLAVHPGDRMSATISEVVSGSNAWTITLKDLTTGQSFSTTVPYSSTHATAEWIEETPLLIGTSGTGLSAMPNLGTVHFTNSTVNGAPAGLRTQEQMQLVGANGNVLATPSVPISPAAFNDCTYSTSCSAAAAKKRHHHH